jgi:hypothetical protein
MSVLIICFKSFRTLKYFVFDVMTTGGNFAFPCLTFEFADVEVVVYISCLV